MRTFRLCSLPEELASLLQLQSLSLAHCRLQVLPACVGQLTQLCHLDVSHNRLGALPDASGVFMPSLLASAFVEDTP